jgi:hypothetical protein
MCMFCGGQCGGVGEFLIKQRMHLGQLPVKLAGYTKPILSGSSYDSHPTWPGGVEVKALAS